jgi:hypothetical protein
MGAAGRFHPGLPIAIAFLVACTTIGPSQNSLSPLIRCTFSALGTERKAFDPMPQVIRPKARLVLAATLSRILSRF